MSLTPTSLLIAAAAALLGIVGAWAGAEATPVWRLVLVVWLAGLAYEWLLARRLALSATVAEESRQLFLGRPSEIGVTLRGAAGRPVEIEYAPSLPVGLHSDTMVATARLDGTADLRIPVLARRLGEVAWQQMAVRVLGRLGLVRWPRRVRIDVALRVVPDTLGVAGGPSLGASEAGLAQRPVAGGGSELLYLRPYRPGDPRRAIDWKATARAAHLVTRVSSEDQHLEIVVAIDAGRTSRVETDGMSHFAHFANLAARFAEYAVRNEDRVGLVVFADRPLVAVPLGRGTECVLRIRRALARQVAQPVESDVVAAVLRVRSLVRHRALVVLLTDLYESSATGQLAESVRVLRPTHVAVIAGVIGAEVAALGEATAAHWMDPYRSLAATQYRHDVRANTARLRRMGAWATAARPAELDRVILERYRTLRRQRRV